MQITHIASFLVSPGKNIDNPPEVKGTMLHPKGDLYDILNEVFEKSEKECNIPIRFVVADKGTQQNGVRDLITAFIEKPTLLKGKEIAERMRDCTTPKSGPALFFIIIGGQGKTLKIVLSRFPADQGILALPLKSTLQVKYIKRVFMKNAETYKAALYQGTSLKGGFWTGKAVDKQANELANYWIYEFLSSDFETTSKFGTQRFAKAMREATKKTEMLEIKKQFLAVANLIQGISGQSISINDIAGKYGLSEDAKDALVNQLAYPELADDIFVLDIEEFSKSAAYSSIELDNGGILSAPIGQFDDCFQRQLLDNDPNHLRFTTVGRIIDERIKGHR